MVGVVVVEVDETVQRGRFGLLITSYWLPPDEDEGLFVIKIDGRLVVTEIELIGWETNDWLGEIWWFDVVDGWDVKTGGWPFEEGKIGGWFGG